MSFVWAVIIAVVGWILKRMFERFLDKKFGKHVDALADALIGGFEAAYNHMQEYLKIHTLTEVVTKAENNDPEAQFYLGLMYYFGREVAKNYSEAVKWCRKSAEQGYTDAQCLLGGMYLNGEGVKQDKTEAVKWFKKAAMQGYAPAQDALKKIQ